ncbi:MAG: hypothetical protein PHS57_08895 [Alphaproteobacteria bacterium]|nr:hypothetical protein [Alphaproteobacteria bacterium]
MFEAIAQNKELAGMIKTLARPIDFDSFTARPTHGYFERVAAREAAELKVLRESLAGFGYCT